MSLDVDGQPRGGPQAPDWDDDAARRVGWLRYFFADDRWEWSAQVQIMHGYEPGTVTPTTKLVLSHAHPQDQRSVTATLHGVRRHLRPLSTSHRIIDTGRVVRQLLLVADILVGETGGVVGAQGFFVDVTPSADAQQDQVTAAVADFTENRATIEQAKGMLMVVYAIDADAAFQLLRWQSQHHNVKLRRVAERVVRDFAQASRRQLVDRAVYDDLLLTAHRRSAAEQR